MKFLKELLQEADAIEIKKVKIPGTTKYKDPEIIKSNPKKKKS